MQKNKKMPQPIAKSLSQTIAQPNSTVFSSSRFLKRLCVGFFLERVTSEYSKQEEDLFTMEVINYIDKRYINS